tara:strand:+ start:33057 stop:34022 length:966 start_codon:yes stop_codon:yes gene_type:complete
MFNNFILSFFFHRPWVAHKLRSLLQVALLSIFLAPSYAASVSETKLPLGGHAVLTGSVALANLITLWAEDFTERNPDVFITVADAGSAVGVEALLNGSANSVLTDMPLSRQQKQRFINRFGYAPTLFPVAMGGVVVYVNSLNPLQQISIPQLDAIYSATLLCGNSQLLDNWGQLGVQGELNKNQITAMGLTAAHGSYQLFKEVALCDGDFRSDFQALAGPAAVEAALTNNSAAIGFSSSARRSAGIRALAIAPQVGEVAVSPSIESIQSGRYPLARTLKVIINLPPGQNASPVIQAFLDYARSDAGQAVATQADYVPLPVY